MIEPAKYESDGDGAIEPETPCGMCALCLVCLGCGLCKFCDCVTTPLSDVGKVGGAKAIGIAAW